MTLLAFSLVLLAALSHAIWNSWLKVTGDRFTALAAIGIGWACVGLAAAAVVGPPDRAVWPWLAASVIVHTAYAVALTQSYRHGDLAVAYSIARGVGPLVVLAVSILLLGETVGALAVLGALLIVGGAVGIGLPWRRQRPALLLPVLTGGLIGTYTLLDGLGGRAGGSPHAFAAWLFLLTSVPVMAIAAAVHGRRFGAMLRPVLTRGAGAGLLSAGAYWVVIWAMSVAPMGVVAALRESSVVFAALIGAFLLGERVRWPGIGLVVTGVVLTKVG